MARVLGDQDHRDEEEQAQLGAELAEVGKAEGRHAHKRRLTDGVEVDVARRLGARARRIHDRDHVADHDADEHRQQAREPAEIHGGRDGGEQRHGGGERLAGVVARGRAGQRKPDHGNHRAGHHRRQQVADRVHADDVNHGADDQVDNACDHDSGISEAVIWILCSLHGQHRADEGKARAQVARDLEPGDSEEDQGRDPAKKNHRVGIEAEDQWHQDRGAEHRHHVLQSHEDGLGPRKPILGVDDVPLACPYSDRHSAPSMGPAPTAAAQARR